MCVRVLAAQCARGLRLFSPSQTTRGRREDRVRAAPAVSCAKCTKKSAHEHTGSAESIRPSLRNGFTAYGALSSVNGLSCHRRLAENFPQDLTPASGRRNHTLSPYASAALVSRSLRVHRIPPRVRDDRDPPLSSGETRKAKSLICPTAKAEYFLRAGLTGFWVICPSRCLVASVQQDCACVRGDAVGG